MASYFKLRAGATEVFSLDWTSDIAGETLLTSVWAVPAGITLVSNAFTAAGLVTFRVTGGTEGQVYRLTNTVTTATRTAVADAVVYVEAVSAGGAYLSAPDAEARLFARFGLEVSLSAGDLDAASDEVDGAGPFLGAPYTYPQARQFPRSHLRGADIAGVVPDAVLDFVALRAAHLAQADPTVPVRSEGVGDVSVTYASPKGTRLDTLLAASFRELTNYRRRTGVLA